MGQLKKAKLNLEQPDIQAGFSDGVNVRYESGALTFKLKGKPRRLPIDGLWLPATPANPQGCRLVDDADRVGVCVALAELAFQRSRDLAPDIKSIQKRIAVYRNTLDFLRSRGVYRLSDATPDHLQELLNELAHGGWYIALALQSRWDMVAKNLTADQHKLALRFLRLPVDTLPVVDALRMPFWSRSVGIGTKSVLPESTRLILESTLPYKFAARWSARKETPPSAPSADLLAMILGWINDLTLVHGTTDRLGFLPYQHPHDIASRMAETGGGRTETITLDETVKLMEGAFYWIYECAPHVVSLLQDASRELLLIPRKKRKNWLSSNAHAIELSRLTGSAIRQWSANQRAARADLTVDELIAACQGACAVVIAFLNARRHTEICDAELGLRTMALRSTEVDDVWEIDFYVAKTYKARHPFFVTRTTAHAIECLESIRNATVPATECLYSERTESIFWAGRPTLDGIKEDIHFFAGLDDKRTRTLATFISSIFPQEACPDFHLHVGRRMFALIYMYRHTDPRIRALGQHLRHFALVTTRTYVTDPPRGVLSNIIDGKLALGSGGKGAANSNLENSLIEELLDLGRQIEQAGSEKLLDTVKRITNGSDMVGGFPRLVRHLHRSLSKNIAFTRLSEAEQQKQVCGALTQRGYRIRPKRHGDCHLKDNVHTVRPKCEMNGQPHPELASVVVCSGCMFFASDPTFQGELGAAETQWNRDRNDLTLPVLQQNSAEDAYQNFQAMKVSKESRNDPP
ncbi:hypothetical protein SAMN05216466_1058 [Paraburkholderia phenazinium]|uniref:Tyr recombinase domain-containing protein n=1 Tax=Paraburkholderia phenazinium TaxID=60549 RepID=A0A1G7WQR2_9BURK|nr:hypothetical protein [Paraburkholderia phenazinium]SDG74263.1 hypothetical protein SAMN05216466_1058 [Paraburkholderia phenazinium]